MDVLYRDARVEDAGALADFARASFVETFGHLYRPEDLAAFLAASYGAPIQLAEILDSARATRLAFIGERLVGYAQIGPYKLPMHPGPVQAMELYRLYVESDVKGAGVAPTLMDWAIGQAHAQQAGALFLGVWEENARARKFYGRYGFRQVGRYEFEVGAARDQELILRLDLV
jgi:ribosomal protein S18 acetylase RimI-like enzyme